MPQICHLRLAELEFMMDVLLEKSLHFFRLEWFSGTWCYFFFCLFLWALKLHLYDGLVVIFYDHQSVEVWSPGVEGRAFQENGSLRTEATKGPLTTSVSRTRLLCPFCTEAGFAHLPLSPETLSPALTTPQICTGNNKQHLMNFSSQLRLDVGYSCCRPVSWSSWSEPEQALLSWNMNWVMM